jgi:3-keto-disaccharide hydrolase
MDRIHFIYLMLAALLAVSCGRRDFAEKGFVPIFNGEDLSGWGNAAGFKVDDGCILSAGENAGNMFTNREYGNYILRLEYKLSKVGNSGVLIRSIPDSAWQTGFEVQLLAPWTPYRDDLHCTGSMYGYVPVTNRPDETTGVWHKMEIVCDRKSLVVSVDGQAVSWAHMDQVSGLKEKNLTGCIGLQGNHSDTGQWVRFRNLRIRNLDSEPDYVARGFLFTDPALRRQAHYLAANLGIPMVGTLCELMSSGDSTVPSAARQALFAIAARATAMSQKAGQDSLATILRDQAGENASEQVREYLGWLHGMLEQTN